MATQFFKSVQDNDKHRLQISLQNTKAVLEEVQQIYEHQTNSEATQLIPQALEEVDLVYEKFVRTNQHF